MLDLDAFRRAPLLRDPFDCVVVPGFVAEHARAALRSDFPRIARPGSFPVTAIRYGPAFGALLDELRGDEFRAAVSDKLGIDLEGRPLLVTVRGWCGRRDGAVHTDAVWKIVSALLYLNEGWESGGGRLRLLRSRDLDDVALEIPPEWGRLFVFRRSDRSLHGHRPFEGERRAVQLTWATTQAMVGREEARHRRSAFLKRIFRRAA